MSRERRLLSDVTQETHNLCNNIRKWCVVMRGWRYSCCSKYLFNTSGSAGNDYSNDSNRPFNRVQCLAPPFGNLQYLHQCALVKTRRYSCSKRNDTGSVSSTGTLGLTQTESKVDWLNSPSGYLCIFVITWFIQSLLHLQF